MWKPSVRPTPTVRAPASRAGDLLIWAGSLLGAFLIRFDGHIPPNYLRDLPVLLALLIPVKLFWNASYRLYQLTWRAVGLTEIMNAAKANTFSLLTVTAVVLLFRMVDAFADLPRSVLLMDYVLTTCGVVIFRASRRGWPARGRRVRSDRNSCTSWRAFHWGRSSPRTSANQGSSNWNRSCCGNSPTSGCAPRSWTCATRRRWTGWGGRRGPTRSSTPPPPSTRPCWGAR